MKIIEIVVSAGRTFNDPFERYSNYRPSLTLKATLSEEENREDAVVLLQESAERLVEKNKQRLLTWLEKKEIMRDEIIQKEKEIKELKDDDIPF